MFQIRSSFSTSTSSQKLIMAECFQTPEAERAIDQKTLETDMRIGTMISQLASSLRFFCTNTPHSKHDRMCFHNFIKIP